MNPDERAEDMNRDERAETSIAEIRSRVLRIPFDEPLVTASFPIHAIDTVLVELRTRGDGRGVSWIFGFGEQRAVVLHHMVRDLADLVLGQDIFANEGRWESMHRHVAFTGVQGVATLAMSAIDTACWDAVGRHLGMPIHRLLGAGDGRVRTYASEGLWLDRDRDELASEAQALVDRGFRAVKMRAGAGGAEDVARVATVREAIGDDVALMVDANQAWDNKEAVRMARRLEEFDLAWLEEPVRYDDLTSMAEVRRAILMPLCTGENDYGPSGIRDLLRAEAADIVMPDLMRMGGVTGWLKAARVAEVFNTTASPHLFMEASAHLAAACPNGDWQEHQPWWEPIIAEPVEVVDGEIVLSDRPGFGIELDEAAVRRFAVTS